MDEEMKGNEMMRVKANESDPSGIFSRGKALRFPRAPRLRFFLFLAGMMATGAGTAGDVSPCSVDSVPIEVMTPGRGGSDVIRSVAELSDSDPHFRAFVGAVTEHVKTRLAGDDLCIKGAGSMDSAAWENHSLLQFVHWRLAMGHGFYVPVMTFMGGLGPPSCRITSPWIDLVVDRKQQVPSIRGIVYWNERQLLADQAVLAGARNVPAGVAMPLKPSELGHFVGEYRRSEIYHEPTKPVEERVPPDILWLLRRTWSSTGAQTTHSPLPTIVSGSMYKVTEKSAENYTKFVLALIERCFASDGVIHYDSILDVADAISIEQYRIDTPRLR